MSRYSQTLIYALTACLAITTIASGAVDEKANAERAVTQLYRQYENAVAEKNAAKMFSYCDPSYQTIGLQGDKSGLDHNIQSMTESLTKVKTIKATIQPEATDMMGNLFFVRYKQTFEILFPLKNAPTTTWFIAEDTWQQKNGQWKLMSTKVVNDSLTYWKQRLEVQKKQMEFEDEQRRSQRCLNGLGYGCGGAR